MLGIIGGNLVACANNIVEKTDTSNKGLTYITE